MDKTSERLRALRGSNLQSAVSHDTGISRSSLSQYENGMRPPLDALITLASYYHVSLDYLAGLSNEKTPQSGVLGILFDKADAAIGECAPTTSDVVEFLEALIRYGNAGAPCGVIPTAAWKGFMSGLTAALNAATNGDVGKLVDKTNAATVAALEVTKMPAAFYDKSKGME